MTSGKYIGYLETGIADIGLNRYAVGSGAAVASA
jgi:hypothetical protein